MESPIWFCGAPADPVAGGLARRVAGLGVAVVESPAGAGRAAVVLSPELAAADPPELGAWVADRGVDELVLVVAAGQAGWDEDAETFAGDAVPDSLGNAFRARPFVIDLRGADDAKLDRFAHRIAGAQEAAPAVAANRRRRRVAGAAAVIGVLLVAMVVIALGGSELPMTGTSTPTTGRSSTPSSSVPGTSDGSSNTGSWIVIAVLATALAVALVQLARRPKSSPAPAPAAVALPAVAAPTGAAQVFISHHTAVDGPVAKQLADRLRSRQLKAWIAPESVPPGTEWVFAIEEGLVTSQAALILISPSALEKGWVRKEIQMIVDLEVDGRLYVVPVVVTPCQVPLVLGAYQWVEVADFDRAADELARRFGASSSTAGG